MAQSDRLVVILVALGTNIGLAIVKFIALLLTGILSILAETPHWILDT